MIVREKYEVRLFSKAKNQLTSNKVQEISRSWKTNKEMRVKKNEKKQTLPFTLKMRKWIRLHNGKIPNSHVYDASLEKDDKSEWV